MISAQAWADAQLLWDYHRMHHEPRPCSVAVGLGSHDLGVADVTTELYHQGMAPVIVFTGATSPTTRERMPRGEAVHYRERALELGVPDSAILLEPHATNTGENIEFTRAVLAEADIEVSSVLLVSKPYEERRSYAMMRKLWPGVDVVSASTPMALKEYADFIGDARMVIDMIVGALQRVLVFPGWGLAIDQDVPAPVVVAYERLCADGFTSRLLPADVAAPPGA
ncbi:YdcF family protein [Streptomyces neyagawaensis]|uniref:YdcF family protein n=1 Tax=Streptomyces neyagawaensis TaxID=42238 RepID=UPI0006E2925C|nr:YdcF family protein [Streptomyces neyagawaensis]MCL6736897.1 YdcF family protein [Streptomyces neyagawaensis]MDE1687233.1 YdcF family protein [Streptomyces neyagawaensis]